MKANIIEPLYRARTIKRDRRTFPQIVMLDVQIRRALEEDQPQSVRHVFYLMTNPRLPESVEKSENGYRQVQDRLVKLRRNGVVPYAWVTDATRRGYFVNTFRSAADFIDQMKGLYRSDLWQYADFYCEVWTESRSIAGVVEDLCRELAVSLYPSGGFTSLSFAYDCAVQIKQNAGDKPIRIFYIGDYDPAGVLIDVKIEQELRGHLPADVDLQFKRIGITEQQILQYDLPTKPRKKTEKRQLQIKETVEAEAMPVGILRELLRTEIESLLPARALEMAKIAEEAERESLDLFASFLSGGDE